MEALINFQAEQAVIGGVLHDSGSENALYAIETCKPDDFSVRETQIAWRAIQALSARGRYADIITVTELIQTREPAYEITYLGECYKNTPSQANLKAYANIVKEYGQLRRAAGALNSALAVLHNKSHEPAERINLVLSEVGSIGADETDQQITNLKDHQAALLQHLEEITKKGGNITGLSTGFENLDYMTGGLRNGDLVIVAARPSMGKTTLVLNMLERIAITNNAPQWALFFSLEMPAQQILQKVYASISSTPLAKILNASVMEDNNGFARIGNAMELMKQSRLMVDDKGGQHLTQIQARAKRMAIKQGSNPAVIVVDYLQLIRAEGESQTIRIGNVSAGLKNLAKLMNCPVVALSQLNRNLTGKPTLVNLRDSGSIEQDADMVIFLHDEDYEGQRDEHSLTEIIFAKNRMGKTGSTFLQPELHLSRFTDTKRLPAPKEHQPAKPLKKLYQLD
ncbi:replicative DNA helicase [Rheinheimera maricola]|uniref:DNA 5'-3' helicase n=1 Tax=Rheinheimera maricola TaxID=2793282 RepID=A0ABS7XAI0_9GAMM|nr:replicative DNA helicase [Rheinheimera maricola]MBZ9612564.1 replicative DNA helicase [Rheinheimera maricola]